MSSKTYRLTRNGIVFVILTALTQIGGILLLLFIPIWRKWLAQFFSHFASIYFKLIRNLGFILFYLFVCQTFIPLIAQPFGRVPLPVFSNEKLKPLNLMTCLLNRHYVVPELLNVVQDVADHDTESTLCYLDAGFPFLTGFPLLPHLSHDDGKKIDLAFFYTNRKGEEVNKIAPSYMGYGSFEGPIQHERDQPKLCAEKGYWQYSLLSVLVPKWSQNDLELDLDRTKRTIERFAKSPLVGKLFIEPHLKTRMEITSEKVRYHGCGAVRHDDHIHVQLK